MIGQSIFFLLFATTVVVAVGWGGQPERLGALVYAGLFVLQMATYRVLPPQFVQVDLAALTTDAAGLAAFGLMAVQAKRAWPIWVAALQLLSVMGHFARSVQFEIAPYAYVLLKTAPTGIGLLAILIGTLAHQNRVKKFGDDPAWMDWNALRISR